MQMRLLTEELRQNSYPGRGIVIGRSADGKKAVTAYFIMGRSVNSRNRVFVEEGRFIHTYMQDGDPLPSFEGEPKRVKISGDIDEFTQEIWESLNEDNKVSLFVRFIDIAGGDEETRIVNKNQ